MSVNTLHATGLREARFWNKVARKYATDPIADPAGYENTLFRVAALLSPAHEVLELGCGTGTTALRLAAGTRRYLATDVADEMVAIAREKWAAQARPITQLRFEVAAAESGRVGTTRYDAVLAFNLLHLVADLDGALRGIVASLKPGGLFISKTPCLAEMNPMVPHVLVPLLRVVGKAPAVRVFQASALQDSLRRHGLEIEATERHGTKRRDMRVFIVARQPR